MTLSDEMPAGAAAADAIKPANEEFGGDDIAMLLKGGHRLAKTASIEEGSFEAKASRKSAKLSPARVKITIEFWATDRLRAAGWWGRAIALSTEDAGIGRRSPVRRRRQR